MTHPAAHDALALSADMPLSSDHRDRLGRHVWRSASQQLSLGRAVISQSNHSP